MSTAIIILAAGASTRMGSPKQLALFNGETLLARTLRIARHTQLSPIIVVLGANAAEIQQQTDLSQSDVVINPRWSEGMSTSLQAGIARAAQHDVEAAVVVTCDMPFVTGDHLKALVALSERTGRNTASLYENRHGIPVCLRCASFAEIMQLAGDTGARSLLAGAPTVALAMSADIDTPADLLLAGQAVPAA